MADIRAELASVLRNIYGDNLSEWNDWLLDADTLLGSAVVARIRAEAWDEGRTIGMADRAFGHGEGINPYRQTSTDVHPAHSGHEYGGAYARAAALAAGDPDWMNATGGTPEPDDAGSDRG